MICDPSGPCGATSATLVSPNPPPGLDALSRRLGCYDDFVADLIARIERTSVDGRPLGSRWDIEGDPYAVDLARLWAVVAEGVAAYTELTAGEAYLRTVRDWADLSRLADQVGYRPNQRVAAEGWVMFDIEHATTPVVPAGTRVQASGDPAGAPPQPFEVLDDITLLPDWAGLTATWVPQPAVPTGRSVRFLGDPGFRAGDVVLLIAEKPPDPSPKGWLLFWTWVISLLGPPAGSTVTPIAVVNVVGHERQLGTTLVEFDRELGGLLDDPTTSYVAYRILDTTSTARRLSSGLRLDAANELVAARIVYPVDVPTTTDRSVVVDDALEDLSAGRLVAVVDWSTTNNRGDVVPIADHTPIDWEIVPGTTVRVSQLHFTNPVGTLGTLAGPRSVYVLDRRIVATHYEFPAAQPPQVAGAGLQIRVYPAPATLEPPARRLAVESADSGSTTWELLEVTAASSTEMPDPASDVAVGLILDVAGQAPRGTLSFARASGNVVLVRHGMTVSSALDSGDGATPNQTVDIPDSPIAAETGESGTPSSSLAISIEGTRWTEARTLFGQGPIRAFETMLGPEGEVAVRFGDGSDGAIPKRGTKNLKAIYRVGGGTIGEVDANRIDTLLGSIRGVRSVVGAGPTSGGADQPGVDQLRRETPTRARTMDRVVSASDLADVALAFPGVSHATSWLGGGPPGASCPPGAHVAILRRGRNGPRVALASELHALSAHLDARRDVSIPLCVVPASVVPVALHVTVVCDPMIEPNPVRDTIVSVLTDLDGPLGATARALGQSLDRSDVITVIHAIAGVVGIDSLTLATPSVSSATSPIGRLAADRHELLVISELNVTVVPA